MSLGTSMLCRPCLRTAGVAACGRALRLCSSSSPALQRFFSAEAETNARPRFAVGFSSNPALSLAVTEAVEQVQRGLGGVQPDLLQLLVSSQPYHRYLPLAPAFAYECFTGPDLKLPVLVGGAVESVMSLMPRPASGPGVSLLAASLPGVRLFPFHSDSDSVPGFTPEQWQALLHKPMVPGSSSGCGSGNGGSSSSTNSGSGGGREALTGLIFVEPHFVTLESFLSRLHNLLPQLTVVGGVVQPGNVSSGGGQTSSVLPGHGAVFLNSETHPAGIAGCLMQGPLELRTRVASSCRPVGPVMRVTASRGNTVLQLDHIPAMLALRQAMEALGRGGEGMGDLPLEVGLDASGRGAGFLARGLGAANPALGSVQLMVAEVPEGALLQLHLLDKRWGAAHFKGHVERLLRPPTSIVLSCPVPPDHPALQQDGSGSATGGAAATATAVADAAGRTLAPGGILDPGASSSGDAASQVLLSFSCTTVANDEPWALEGLARPGGPAAGVALQGGKFQGELGPGPGGGPTALYSFTSTLGLLRGM